MQVLVPQFPLAAPGNSPLRVQSPSLGAISHVCLNMDQKRDGIPGDYISHQYSSGF